MSDLYQDLLQQIDDFRDSNSVVQGVGSGGRFLVCNQENLTRNNGVILMGENPGGSKKSSDIEGSVEESPFLEGNNGTGEDWDSSMQTEVRNLLAKLSDQAGKGKEDFISQTLVSNFIFFRSKKISDLDDDEVMTFCREIWQRIFLYNISNLKLLICSGKTAWDNMRQIFDYFPDAESHSWDEIELEYQKTTRKIWVKSKRKFNDDEFMMCRLPNLTDRNVNALGGGIFDAPADSFSKKIDQFLDITGKFL